MLAPGVPLTHPAPHWTVQRAHKAGVEVIGDIELFCRERRALAPDAPFVAITGTNGKSTTTALIAHLVASAGMDAQLGGNIGTAILSLAPPRQMSEPARSCHRVLVLSDRSRALARSFGRHPDQSQRRPSRPPRHDGALRRGEGAPGRRRAAERHRDRRRRRRMVPRHRRPSSRATGKRVVRVFGAAALTDGFYVEQQQIMRAASGTASVDRRARRHRLAARRAQRAERRLRRRRRAGARPRPAGDPGRPALVSRASRTAWRKSAAAAPCCSSTIPRRPTPIRRRRRSPASTTFSGSPAASRRPAASSSLRKFFPRIRKAYLIGEAAQDFAATLGGDVPHEIDGHARQGAGRRGARRRSLGRARAGGAAVAGLRLVRPVPQFRGPRRRVPRAGAGAAGGSRTSEAVVNPPL